MLTAVESTGSHLGSGRSYNAHHLAYGVSNGPSPSITAGTGLNSYATNPVPAAMSAEFVKPHPKMGRYGSLPSSRHSDGAGPGSNGVTHSPGSKYKFNSACADQPVNLVTSSAQSDGSGAQVMASGIDKLKSEFDLMKAANIPGNFADFLYGRHAAAAAAAAAGFLAPQSTYSSLMYPPTAPAPQQMYPAESQRSSLSPGKVAPIGRGNSDSATPFHHLQQQQQQPRSQGGSTGNSLTGYGYSGQPTKILKGASPGFILPPPPPPPSMSMIPTQAELEAYHAYHQEMGRGMYYNGHVPLPEHLIPVHRMQSSVSHLHTPTPQSPVSMSMCRGSQQQSSSSSISKRQPNGGAIDSGLYHQPQSHRSQSSGIGEKGPKGDKNNNIGFKVPSGKEGSMKHRLLTTNSVKTKERKGKAQKQMCASYGTSNIIKSNFNKGVLIELGNGELKPVEEMRTEDFILSSNVTPSLEMIDSTVLRITPTSFAVILTLSNSASKLNIDLTVAPEHPFFVYRQGWASCNPEGTFQMHGLKCRRLEVGDVCISLMQKDRQISGDFSDTLNAAVRINSGSSSSSTSSSLSSPPPPLSSSSAYSASQEEPQNLSRKQSPRGLIEGTTYHPSLSAPPPSSSAHAFVHTTHLLSHAPQQQARSFSSLKHNYLAAFEQAAASAKINGPVLSHSIKNIVMGGIDDDKRSESSPAIADPATRHAQFSSESASKRRYSAPDNIYGDSPALIGDLEPPPKKIASH